MLSKWIPRVSTYLWENTRWQYKRIQRLSSIREERSKMCAFKFWREKKGIGVSLLQDIDWTFFVSSTKHKCLQAFRDCIWRTRDLISVLVNLNPNSVTTVPCADVENRLENEGEWGDLDGWTMTGRYLKELVKHEGWVVLVMYCQSVQSLVKGTAVSICRAIWNLGS